MRKIKKAGVQTVVESETFKVIKKIDNFSFCTAMHACMFACVLCNWVLKRFLKNQITERNHLIMCLKRENTKNVPLFLYARTTSGPRGDHCGWVNCYQSCLCFLLMRVEQVKTDFIDFLTSIFSSSAWFPVQGQPPVYGLQLPAALRARLLRLPHHPQGKIIHYSQLNLVHSVCWCFKFVPVLKQTNLIKLEEEV